MMTDAGLSDDGATFTVWIPMEFKPRGGRKLVVSPDGVPAWAESRSGVDDTLFKALARAFRWRRLLETGAHGTVDEIARAEGINDSYVSRVLRLTLLAPDIVEAALDGRQPPPLTLARLMKPFPAAWEEAGWPRAVTHPRLPRFRACPIRAPGSSDDGLAAQRYTLCTTRAAGRG